MSTQSLGILHVASGDLWGGAEAMLLDLAVAQRTLEDDARVVLLNDGLLASRLREREVPVIVIPEARLSTGDLVNRVTAECERFGPDVVHTHRLKENVIGALAARKARIATCVRTAHGDSEHAAKWHQFRKKLAPFAERLLVRTLQHGTAAVSQELADKLRARWLSGPISVVENGIDPVRIQRAARDALVGQRQADSVNVAFVGRLVPVKRVDLFIDSCASLARLLDRKVYAWIVGDGPQRIALEGHARARMPLDCRFTGFVDEPAAMLSGMDALVITSDHEGLPIVLLEAIALGVAVASRAVGGIPQVLEGLDRSRLVSSDRPEAMALALAELLGSSARQDRSQDAPRLPSRYTSEAMAHRYREFYSEARK